MSASGEPNVGELPPSSASAFVAAAGDVEPLGGVIWSRTEARVLATAWELAGSNAEKVASLL